MSSKDFSYQGRVTWETRNADGSYSKPRWLGDTDSDLTLTLEQESEQRTESYTGQRVTSATLSISKSGTINMALRYDTIENLALGVWGTPATIAAGTATAEALPEDLVEGDVVALANGGASDIVLTDSTPATPITLVEGTHYQIESRDAGTIRILDVATLVQPLLADYAYAGGADLGIFTQQPPEGRVTVHQINTVDGSRQRVQLFRVKPSPVSDLGLLHESFGTLPMSGEALFDETAATDGTLGGFGSIRKFTASAPDTP